MDENNQAIDAQEGDVVDNEARMTEIKDLDVSDEEVIMETPQTLIAGFWRRLAAFIIDGAIIGIPLIILGFVLRDVAFSLGPWGRIIGFMVIIPYWGYFNSEKRSGQTLGKQITKIAVVDHNNHYLSVGKSFLRAFMLSLIFMLNGWALPIMQNRIIMIIVTGIIIGGTLTLVYALVFNRTTRQGIHDLLIGSYVIKAPPVSDSIMPQIPRIHQRITYGLLGIGLLFGVAFLFIPKILPTSGILESGEWEEIQELQSALMDQGEFYSANVIRVNRSQIGSGTVLKDLNIEVWVKISCIRDPGYCDDLIEQIAMAAFEQYDNIENLSGMRITVTNRFDLGLARGNLSRGVAWSMEDWQKELEK